MPNERSPSRIVRVLDFLFVLRPAALVPLWVFFLAGARLAASGNALPFPLFFPPRTAFIGLLSMTFVLAGGYILNQICDRATDRENRKLFLVESGAVPMRAAWAELAVLWICAALLSLALSPPFRAVLAASLALTVTYSLPPVRAKARTPWDLVWNAAGFGLAGVLSGYASMAPLAPRAIAVGGAYALSVAGIIASTTILDIEGDRKAGLRTTATVLGETNTGRLAVWLLAAGAAIGFVARDTVGIAGPLLSLPFLVRAGTTGRRSDRIRAHQIAVAIFAILVGVHAVYLLASLCAIYFLSRFYYRSRFGFAYPGSGTP
jgi:4-hydroxybenzoate polyprenyltransferase